jgi:hypothetical protein
MDLVQFHKMRTAIQDNAYPGSGTDLETVESNLREVLMASGVFERVEVEHTNDLDRLVIALCDFRPDFDEFDIAGRIEELWHDQVRYQFWEAHSLMVDREHVEFQAATRADVHGHYVTVHLVAKKSRIPAQRVPMD